FGIPVGVATQLAGFVPALRSALSESSPASLATSLEALAGHIATSDGVVPFSSQIPTGGSWQAGTAIVAFPDQQPADASALSQILSQIDTWAGAGSRAVLLLGPSFTTHAAWAALLASPQLHGTTSAAANFDFRTGSPDPSSVNLNAVTDAVDYYTADLIED